MEEEKLNWWQIILVFVLLVPYTIFRGFVITQYWDWFVAPTFDIPSLSIAVATGIASLITLLTYNQFATVKPGSVWSKLGAGTVYVALAWGFGGIVSLFV